MKNVSYWMETADGQSFAAMAGEARCDVAVIGAGLTGITTALMLAESGADVIAVDANTVGSGTSGHTTAKITVQHALKYHTLAGGKAAAYAAANQAGLDQIAAFVDTYGISCDFCRSAAFVYAQNSEDVAQLNREMRAYETAGIQGRLVTKTPLPFAVRGALMVEDQAQFHPLKYLYALTEALVRCGGTVYEHTTVRGVDSGSPCVVHTSGGDIEADRVVYATGYPISDLHGLFFMKLHQQRSYIICTDVKSENVTGMHITAGLPVNSVRTHTTPDGSKQLLLGGYGHRTGEEADNITGYGQLEEFLLDSFQKAGKRPSYGWSAQDCMTLDGLPYVGAIDGDRRLYAATGYEKWGMTNSMAAAMMMTDSIIGSSMIDKDIRDVFSPVRFTPAASAKEFFVQTGHAIKAFTVDNIIIPEGTYDDIAPGEGAVLRIDGKAQAVYKDEDGTVHTYKAHCTHLGCPLEYNAAERSFDCSCHGSRFGMGGTVLEGPARRPLEVIGGAPEE